MTEVAEDLDGTSSDARAEPKAKRFTVRHVSVYRYSEPVGFGEHRMMFRPRASHDLRLVATDLAITPAPAQLHWLHDVFDNSVAIARFAGAADELRFDSRVTLEHVETTLPDYALEHHAVQWPFVYSESEASDLAQGRQRQYPDTDVDAWARTFLPPGGEIGTMALLRAMTLGIKSGFRYVRRVERGLTTPPIRCGTAAAAAAISPS